MGNCLACTVGTYISVRTGTYPHIICAADFTTRVYYDPLVLLVWGTGANFVRSRWTGRSRLPEEKKIIINTIQIIHRATARFFRGESVFALN